MKYVQIGGLKGINFSLDRFLCDILFTQRYWDIDDLEEKIIDTISSIYDCESQGKNSSTSLMYFVEMTVYMQMCMK